VPTSTGPFRVNTLCVFHGEALSPQSIKDGLREQARHKITQDPAYTQGTTRLQYLFVHVLSSSDMGRAVEMTQDVLCLVATPLQGTPQQARMVVEGTLPFVTEMDFWGSLELILRTDIGALVSIGMDAGDERGTYYSPDDPLGFGRAVRHTRPRHRSEQRGALGLSTTTRRSVVLRFILDGEPGPVEWAAVDEALAGIGIYRTSSRTAALTGSLIEWRVEATMTATTLGHDDVRDNLERRLTAAMGVRVRLVEYSVVQNHLGQHWHGIDMPQLPGGPPPLPTLGEVRLAVQDDFTISFD
jgi:hypothetical protein